MAEQDDASDAVFLVVAAGRGSRAGAGGPKQYRELAGRQVLTRTLEALLDAAPQAPGAGGDPCRRSRSLPGRRRAAARGLRARLLPPVFGGATRQDSVCNGLEAIDGLGVATTRRC